MEENLLDSCQQAILPASDALHVLNGRWRLHVLLALTVAHRRFGQLCKDIPGITPRMLSKELRELEINQLLVRKASGTVPSSVEYALSDYGRTLKPLIVALRDWGAAHRARIMSDR